MKRIKPEILTQLDDHAKIFKIYCDALNILADIAATTEQHRPANSTIVYVGHFVHEGVRVTGRILGPLRVDGGLLLVTRQIETRQNECHDTQHLIYRLEDFLQTSRDDLRHVESLSKIQALLEKSFTVRERIGSEATNYFSGGKVVKSL